MAKEKQKKVAYMCETDWSWELGETKTSIYPTSKEFFEKNHTTSCGIVEVEVKLRRVVKKPAPYDKSNTYSPLEATKSLIQKTEEDIVKKKDYLKRLKKDLKSLEKRQTAPQPEPKKIKTKK